MLKSFKKLIQNSSNNVSSEFIIAELFFATKFEIENNKTKLFTTESCDSIIRLKTFNTKKELEIHLIHANEYIVIELTKEPYILNSDTVFEGIYTKFKQPYILSLDSQQKNLVMRDKKFNQDGWLFSKDYIGVSENLLREIESHLKKFIELKEKYIIDYGHFEFIKIWAGIVEEDIVKLEVAKDFNKNDIKNHIITMKNKYLESIEKH